jgi:formate dehydrogenase beta subunit
MGISRRTALKTLAMAAGTAFGRTAGTAEASASAVPAPEDSLGLLYDTTRCIGCKACMTACNEANDLAPDTRDTNGRWHVPLDLNENCKNIIKVWKDDATGEFSFVKHQCMHCVEPACTTACMLGALSKDANGVVAYNPDLCVGCRYCEMACPFNVPKFEWSKPSAGIVKCELCDHRLAVGREPACTEVCPTDAVIFGKRGALLAEAHRRQDEAPGRYLPRVYGEREAGGTQVLYLSHVPFENIGLPAYGDRPVPKTVKTIQHTLYQGFVAPVALYGLLAGVLLRNRRANERSEGGAGKENER